MIVSFIASFASLTCRFATFLGHEFCPRKVVVQSVASKASSRGSAIGGCKPMWVVKGGLFGNDAFV